MTALPRRRPRTGLLLAVVAGHALLWWVARETGVWRERGAPPPATAPLQVQLIALPPPAAATPPAAPAPQRPPATPAITAPTIEWVAPRPDTPAPAAPPAAAPAGPATPMSASAPAPLRLELPRGAATARRPPALDDPRANSAPRTLESRIAEATGANVDTGGAWTEEPMADGLLRVRRGRECWIVAPNRDNQLDPFNQNAVAKLRSARPC